MTFAEPGVHVVVLAVVVVEALVVAPASAPATAVGAATVETSVGTELVEAGPHAARARAMPTSAPFQGKSRRLCRERGAFMLTLW